LLLLLAASAVYFRSKFKPCNKTSEKKHRENDFIRTSTLPRINYCAYRCTRAVRTTRTDVSHTLFTRIRKFDICVKQFLEVLSDEEAPGVICLGIVRVSNRLLERTEHSTTSDVHLQRRASVFNDKKIPVKVRVRAFELLIYFTTRPLTIRKQILFTERNIRIRITTSVLYEDTLCWTTKNYSYPGRCLRIFLFGHRFCANILILTFLVFFLSNNFCKQLIFLKIQERSIARVLAHSFQNNNLAWTVPLYIRHSTGFSIFQLF